MKNKLERFVNEHRDEFDSEWPAGDVWSSIDTSPRKKYRVALFFTPLRIAAAALLLVNALVIFLLLQKKVQNDVRPVAETSVQQPMNEPAGEEVLEQIAKVVETKQAALKEIRSTNPVLYRKFSEALAQLSTAYRELETEFNKTPNKEAILEAMIQNLSLQQELLNQQLTIYQKIKRQKHEKNDKHI